VTDSPGCGFSEAVFTCSGLCRTLSLEWILDRASFTFVSFIAVDSPLAGEGLIAASCAQWFSLLTAFHICSVFVT
jgi:hypothetical protein